MTEKDDKNYTGMESEEPFVDEMPNFDMCRTVFKELFKDFDVLDVDAKTETAASSEKVQKMGRIRGKKALSS